MSCGGNAANFKSLIIGSNPEQVNFFYNVKLFAIDYRALVDAGLARTKCFLFGKIHFLNRFI